MKKMIFVMMIMVACLTGCGHKIETTITSPNGSVTKIITVTDSFGNETKEVWDLRQE